MKPILYLTCWLLTFHSTPISFFSLHLDKTPFELTIEVDPQYLEWMEADVRKKKSLKAMNKYMENNLEILINEQDCPVVISSRKRLKNGHILLTGTLSCSIEKPETVQIQNNCFIQEMEEQINSVLIHQKEKELRGFNMNEKRTEIIVEL